MRLTHGVAYYCDDVCEKRLEGRSSRGYLIGKLENLLHN